MSNYGFSRTALGIPFSRPGDVENNKQKIVRMSHEAAENGASVILFPELSLSGYTCQDLFHDSFLLSNTLNAVGYIKEKSKFTDIVTVFGAPLIWNNGLYNCAVVVKSGSVLGVIPKVNLAKYREFYEARWFKSGEGIKDKKIIIDREEIPFGTDLLFRNTADINTVIGVEICEDLWVSDSPSIGMVKNGASLILNLSASNAVTGKEYYRKKLVEMQSAKLICAYAYANAACGESTTDLVFDGSGLVYENGVMLCESERFARRDQIVYADIDFERISLERAGVTSFPSDSDGVRVIDYRSEERKIKINRFIEQHPFVPDSKSELVSRCDEILLIQATGLASRIESIGCVKAVIGLSGGLDSTLALLITIKAMQLLGRSPQSEIVPVTMPGFGTTDMTLTAVKSLCAELSLKLVEYSIKDISNLMLDKIEHFGDKKDITYENIQARARTYILMSTANRENGIVIGTGDLSEAALGWSTYNGDHMSMYNVNCGVPKTLVQYLIREIAVREFNVKIQAILSEILSFPISPELLPTDGKEIVQKTESVIGPYELHDFFLYYFVRWHFSPEKILFLSETAFNGRYSREELVKWLNEFIKRFFTSQWKRDCVPAGPKVGSVDLSPRGSWRMSSETVWAEYKLKS